MYDLSALGFGPFFERQLASSNRDDIIPARIAAEHRGLYEVWSSTGAGHARLAGRLRRGGEHGDAPGVGDWVIVKQEPSPDCTVVIHRVLERRTALTRGAAGREAGTQLVAANLDLEFVVCGLDSDFNPRRIERYLARIWASGAQPVVVLNKADLCVDLAAHTCEMERRCIGVPILGTSALHIEGTDPLRERIRPSMTVGLVGSSGAGKSTLVNALLGEERMRTAEVRASDSRGCHTTTHRQLIVLPGGGLLLDTPGMRELQLLDDGGLSSVFGDIDEIAGRCRFRDCKHKSEPGCAVRAALEAGQLDAERVDHCRRLEREARANELRHDARKRRQAGRLWGQLHDEVACLRKWKGDKS